VVIPAARYFYGESKDEVCINSVNASEHSVSTTKIFTVGEKQMLIDWMKTFDKGILSVVMDTFDITKVAKPSEGGYCFDLKNQILSRDGKLVIRPDSGDPVEIICGHGRTELTDNENRAFYPEFYTKGLIECLWDIFGGTINEQGYKVLDPHIGAIYGDSITTDRQIEIYERLAAKGFASTNIVLGVGSYSMRMVTRDTLGFAAKGAWFEENGVEHDIYKDPISDDGTKKSLKGLIAVFEEDGDHVVQAQCTKEEEESGILQTIYEDGKFYNETTLTIIRGKLEDLVSKDQVELV
jgi:nicotinamide phosphoribosyltransferase